MDSTPNDDLGAGEFKADSLDEALYEEYLDAALGGEVEEPGEFLKRKGVAGSALRSRLEGMYRLFCAGLETRTDAPEGLPAERIGDYCLMHELGRGGMGTIYMARQESLDRLVALKLIRADMLGSQVALERLRREARALARLNHPNVVGIHDFGEHEGRWYTAMELIAGRSLSEVLSEAAEGGEPVAIGEVVHWAAQIARALECAHAAGILHRDVKPSNIRVTSQGDAVLVDFGLTRDILAGGATLTEAFIGSPTYASPEQVSGPAELDARTDVYSLGVTLYHAISGSSPFKADTVERVFKRVLFEEPPPLRRRNTAIGRDLEVVVSKAIEKDRERRYKSAAAFADDLEAILEFRPIQARPPGGFERAWKWARRHRTSAASLLAGGLVAIGALVLFIAQMRAETRERKQRALDLVQSARASIETFRTQRNEVREVEAEVRDLSGWLEARYLSPEELGFLDQRETEVGELKLRHELLFYEVLDQLRAAERLDADVGGLDAVHAELYLAKLEQAQVTLDVASMRLFDNLLSTVDLDGAVRARAYPFSQVVIESHPPGAEVHLFRLREQSTLFEGGEPRIVPVPFGEPPSVIRPGTWALRVVRPAGELKLQDLIVELVGHGVEGALFAANDAGPIWRLDRLLAIDGIAVGSNWDLEQHAGPLETAENGERPLRVFELDRGGEHVSVVGTSLAELGAEFVAAEALAEIGDVPALVYRNGVLLKMHLPPGLELRTTAKPYLLSRHSLIGQTPLEMELEAGRYVAILRMAGMEELRLTPSLALGTPGRLQAELLPIGSTPEGFVRVATSGKPDFWMMEREVTCAEYLEFLNDPQTLALIDAADTPLRFPREFTNIASGGHWQRDANGLYQIASDWRADWPIIAVSWDDAQAFARWKTEQARAKGESGFFSLPKYSQVARTGSGFKYSWGDRFRPHWSNSCFSRPIAGPEPVLRYPVDETLRGVYDLCGGAMEWQDEWFDRNRNMRTAGGGAWGQGEAEITRISGGNGYQPHFTTGQTGFRLCYQAQRDE